MLPFHCPIMPGEHVLSWLSRIHLLLGFNSIQQTLKHLSISNEYFAISRFNGPIKGALRLLEHNSFDGLSGFDKHTTLPIWALSVEPAKYQKMRLQPVEAVNHADKKPRIVCQENWKYCHLCVKEDMEQIGHSIWRVHHQIVGITHCVQHKIRLSEDGKTLRDLRYAKLPQVYSLNNSHLSNHPSLMEWSQFLSRTLVTLSESPERAFQVREKVRVHLQIPPKIKRKEDFADQSIELKERFETEISHEVYEHLFRINPVSAKRGVNPINVTMGWKNPAYPSDIPHPIHWLVILFWLRNDIVL